MSAFKAYDFRGVYNQDFDLETIYKFGYFLPQLLEAKKILVGRDMRLSSPAMFDALSRGITDAGADVYNLGLCTTPMVYYFTAKHDFDGSVMITASHNPKDYNGLKVSRRGALPCGYDTGLREIEQKIATEKVTVAENRGKIVEYSCQNEYLAFLKQYTHDISNLNIVMDCSHGMASLLVGELFGTQPHYLYNELDGNFPNHDGNPLEEKNVRDLKREVLARNADVGVIYDGDADRVMFVDELGQFIAPDLMIALMGHYFGEEKKLKGIYIQDIRTSKSVSEYLEKMEFTPYIWRVGRAYAALKLREIDGIFGGEFAGHYYFRDFFYSDSAMMASLIILHIISKFKKKGISLSQIIKQIASYANSGEINFKIEQKQEAMKALKEHFTHQEQPTKIMDFDGYRIEFSDWWFNVRPSNTEPYLRLLMEAKTTELLQEKLNEAKLIINNLQ